MDALTTTFLSLRAELLAFARRRTDGHGAEDIVQDAYINLCSRASPEEWREPRAFLFRTISNLSIDRWRVQKRQLGYLQDGCEAEDIVCPKPTPDVQLSSKQKMEKFLGAFDQLPETTRHIFILNRVDGLGHGEIATRLGISTKTVQRHLERAMQFCLASMPD